MGGDAAEIGSRHHIHADVVSTVPDLILLGPGRSGFVVGDASHGIAGDGKDLDIDPGIFREHVLGQAGGCRLVLVRADAA